MVVASHNPGKVREINDLVAPYGLDTVAAGDLGLAEPVEDGATFVANAEIKARAAAAASGLPSLADDSGLAVDALDGAPGIYSARWAGPDKDFGVAMARVEADLHGVDNRRAHFVCVLALAWPDGDIATFEGRVDGTLVFPPRGDNGFGYDPIFVANGQQRTFGELAADVKHAMSHRADAFAKFMAACLPAGGHVAGG